MECCEKGDRGHEGGCQYTTDWFDTADRTTDVHFREFLRGFQGQGLLTPSFVQREILRLDSDSDPVCDHQADPLKMLTDSLATCFSCGQTFDVEVF